MDAPALSGGAILSHNYGWRTHVPPACLMPAKRKTTPETTVAIRRLFAAVHGDDDPEAWDYRGTSTAFEGMESTPGYTIQRDAGVRGGPRFFHRNPEPVVWVLRRRVRVPGTGRMQDTHPLVTALWATLPEGERRRSRLFVHCGRCPVRFTKKGAIADAHRCGRVGVYSPPSRKERVSAQVRASMEPPRLDPRNEFEAAVAQVWDELKPLHRRTLYAWMRPAIGRREWALEGAPSPEAFASRVRTAERAVARALAARLPQADYSVKTRGRRGFDYERFWDDYLGVGQTP